MKSPWQRILAISSFVMVSLALAIASTMLISPFVYRLSINGFHLQDISGIASEALMENYLVVLKFLFNPWVSSLKMPYFSSSPGGQQHFLEVKLLIYGIFLIGIFAGIYVIWTLYHCRNKRGNKTMQPHFMVAILLPLFILFMIFIAFDQVFYLFHEVFFRNDLWLFDPLTDPVITVLPQGFFMILFVIAILFYEGYILLFRRLMKVA